MLELILTAINAKLAMLNKLANLYCLAERRPIDGGKTVPYAYRGGRDLQPIDIDSGSVGYWRINGEGSDEYINDPYVAGQQRQVTWPLRFYAIAHRDSQFTASALADLIGSTITDADDDVAQMLDMEDVSITVSGRDLDTTALYGSEFDELDLSYHLAFIALTVTVTIRGAASCFPDPCDIDTDILHSFNFCDAATRARLTDEQVDCLTAALCETPPTLCEQLAEVLPADVVADVFDCLTPEAQAELLDSECVIPPCADATITINSDPYGTVPSGGSTNIIVESENNNPLGSLVGGNWEVGNAHLRVNGTAVGNLEPEQWHDHYATINGTQAGSWHNPSQTWRMNVLQGGSPVGSLSGTDWVVPPCAAATAVLKNTANTTLSTTSIASGASQNITAPDATAVLKNTANTTLLTEAIPSNVSENITAPDATITLNGAAYGSAPSGTTFNVVATAPSLSLSTTTSTPAYGASFTITATPSGFTPTSYTFHYVNNVNGNMTSVTQAGSSLALTAIWNGAQTIIVTASDSVSGATATSSISITVSNGLRIPTWILNTAPPASSTGAVVQVGDMFGFQNNGGNNGNCYAAGMTGACGVVWQPIGAICHQFIGLSPNITYSGNQNQLLDPAWDWIFGGPGNVSLYLYDNGSPVNPTILTYSIFWFRMDRAANGTIRLYRGTAPDQCNTLVHTFSLTNTGTLYPKFYDLSGMRYGRAYIYGS